MEKKGQTIFLASRESPRAGDGGEAVRGLGLGASWVDVGDEDMEGEWKGRYLVMDVLGSFDEQLCSRWVKSDK